MKKTEKTERFDLGCGITMELDEHGYVWLYYGNMEFRFMLQEVRDIISKIKEVLPDE